MARYRPRGWLGILCTSPLMWLLLMLAASFPATAAALECKLGTAGFQQLCRLAETDFPLALDDALPPPDVLGMAWHAYVQARFTAGRAPSVLELSALVAEDSAALNNYVDAVLSALPAIDAQAPPAVVRAQLLQVALCPWLLLEDPALRGTPPCTFSTLTPATLTHREIIVALLKQKHGDVCGQPVCMGAPPLPTQIITTLIDWAPALEAEMGRLPACRGSDVTACTKALTDSAVDTATSVVVQALVADWTVMDAEDRCLIEVGKSASIDTAVPLVSQPAGINASLVANLLQATDQAPRRQLAERTQQWRSLATRIRRGQFDAALLARHCTAVVVEDTAKRFFGDAASPTLNANGRLPAQAWRMEDGYVDFASQGDGPLAALRLRYSAPPVNGRCEQSPPIGKLSLIVRVRVAQGQWLAREVPAGVDDIRLPGLCATVRTLDQAVLTLSVQQLGEALNHLVPPPLRLDVTGARLDYQPGAAPGQLRLHVQGQLGIDGIPNMVAVAWDLGSPSLDFSRQALLAHAREVLQTYLQPRLGRINLSLTPPGNCEGTPLPVAAERALALYTCLDLSRNLGLLGNLPAVLLQIELDGSGRTLVRLSPPALNALREPLLRYVRRQVDEYLSGQLGSALSAMALDAIPTGVRVRVTVKLMLEKTPLDWTVSVDLHFTGGESVKEQISRQLRDMEQHKAQLRELARAAAMRRFNEALQQFDLPGVRVQKVNWEKQGVDLVLSTPVPRLGDVPFFVSWHSSNFSEALRDAALDGIKKELDGQQFDYAGLTLNGLGVEATPWRITAKAVFNASPELVATVTLPLQDDFRPRVNADGMRDALGGLLAQQLSGIAGKLLGQAPPLIVEWVNNVPQIRFEVSSSLRIVGDMPFEGTLSALLTQRDGLQLETITVKCKAATCWYPVSFFEVGGFSLTVNPRKLAGLKFEATAAITRANETMKLLRLDTALTVDDPVRLDARLTVLDNWDIGQFSAVLDINRARLEMEGTMRFPIINLDVSQSRILVDGKCSVVVAWVKDDIVNLINAEMTVGLRYAKCKKLESGEPLVMQLLAICGDASRADAAICAKGKAVILGSSLAFSLAMPLKPLGSPVAYASVEVLKIGMETEIRKSYVRMHARAGDLASVTLLLPPLGKFEMHHVEDLLRQALKPKLSWEAFKNREVVLSMLPPGNSNAEVVSGGDGAPPGVADYQRSAIEAARQAAGAQRPPPPVRTAAKGMATGRSRGATVNIDCRHNQLYLGDGTDAARSWKIAPEVCSQGYSDGYLVDPSVLQPDAQGYAVFCQTKACDLRKPMFVSRFFPAATATAATGKSFQAAEAVAALFDASSGIALVYLDELLQRIGAAQFDPAEQPDWNNADAVCVRRAAKGDANSFCEQALVIAGQQSWLFSSTDEAVPVAEGSWLHLVLGKRRPGKASLRQAFGERLDALRSIAGYDDNGDELILAPSGEASWSRWRLNSEGVWQITELQAVAAFPLCDERRDRYGNPDCPEDPCVGTSAHEPACVSSRALVATVTRNLVPGERCQLSPNGVSWCGPASQNPAAVTRSFLVVTDARGGARVLEQSPQCLRAGAMEWQKSGLLQENVAVAGQGDLDFLQALDVAVKRWRGSDREDMRADPSQLYLQSSPTCRSGM